MKIAIAGYGVEGKQNLEYWQAFGTDEITVVDERETLDNVPAGVATILGEGAFEKLADFDIVVRTAGLAPRKIKTNGTIWSATNEFFAKCPAPIIGVTGTKGKGTTASIITSILRAAGKTVHLVGNIGVPALGELAKIQPDDIVVYELSSFQLWDAQKSPHVAVVLMIEPDHLNVHLSFSDYIAAKANIARHQGAQDILVFNRQNKFSTQIAELSPAHKIAYPFDISAVVDSLKIPGHHNIENAAAAIAAVREYVTDDAVIQQGLAAFDGLPHRLKFVAEVDGVKFYDDSIATTNGSAIAALRSFDGPKVIILGGSDKGSDYDEVIAECRVQDARVIAIGETGERIADLCENEGVLYERIVGGTMVDIVNAANKMAQDGDVVILSPAAASFDMFKGYADRGDQFSAAVQAIA